MESEATNSISESAASVEKEISEKHGRYKMRKYANRQAFQERRKIGSLANTNLGFERHSDRHTNDRAFSISSESNTRYR